MGAARIGSFAAAVVVAAVVAGGAGADGLPVLGIDVGADGVAADGGAVRYVTIPARGDTVVAQVARSGGRVVRWRLVRGTFTIPAVAYDRSAGGLAADGRTLALIAPRLGFPRTDTTLLVLDARRLAPRRSIRLRGDFSFDAISPGGRWLYLIQYLSPRDPTRYAVRAYDVRAGRLAPRRVVDPREPGERMQGVPLSRAASTDGRWAYTLYERAAAPPFVHALDTAHRTARCIDLDALARVDVSRARLRLAADGRTLVVRDPGGALAFVDPTTWTVTGRDNRGRT